MRLPLLKGRIIANCALASIGLVLLARWAQQPMASPDEVTHDPSRSLQLPSRRAALNDGRQSSGAADRAQYSLCLSMFKHVIQNLENSAGTAVEGSV